MPLDIATAVMPELGKKFGLSLTAQIEQILLTRPLARIRLASDPPVTALMLHREIEY
jgi:hypothetical protein